MLEAEPGLVLGMGGHELGTLVAIVELVGCAIVVPALGEDENVGAETNGVGEDGNGLQVHIRVLAGRLAGGGAIKVPYREVGRVPFFICFEGLETVELARSPPKVIRAQGPRAERGA